MSRPVCDNRKVQGRNSIVGGGALSTDLTLQLRGDESDPGDLAYYGTDNSGTKGWYELPKNIQDLISLEARVKALESTMASVLVRLNAAEGHIADLLSRVTALEAMIADDLVFWYETAVDYEVTSGANHVRAIASGITITLPSALSVRKIVVKNTTGGIVGVTSVSLIDGLASAFLAGKEAIQCVSDGATWHIT